MVEMEAFKNNSSKLGDCVHSSKQITHGIKLYQQSNLIAPYFRYPLS